MLSLINGKIELCEKNVTYTHNGENLTQPVVEGEEWWTNFATKWGINDLSFSDIIYDQKEIDRFNEIREMSHVDISVLWEYVKEGTYGNGLELLKVEKINHETREIMADIAEIVLFGGGEKKDE